MGRRYGPALARDNSPTRPQRPSSALQCAPFLQRRPPLDPPRLAHCCIALGRSCDGQVGRPGQGRQQPRDIRLVVRDAERLPADRRSPSARPQLAAQSGCFRAMGYQCRKHLPVVGCQLHWPGRARLGPPGLTAARTGRCHPRADHGGGDANGGRKFTRFPPVLLAFQRPLAAPFLPGCGQARCAVHVRSVAYGKTAAEDATVCRRKCSEA